MDIKHRTGSRHRNADALSRVPRRHRGFEHDWKAKINVNTVTPALDMTNITQKEASEGTLGQLREKDKNLSIVKQWVRDGHKPDFKRIGNL